jgi:hypothetical protein
MMTLTKKKRIAMKFPTVNGSNLLKQKLTLPEDFEGDLNLIFLPFQRWHQMEVNSWGAVAEELEKQHPTFRYYELPTIQRMNPLAHFFIDEGMRGGIPDAATRKRTITLYLDKSAFMRSLELQDQNHIYLLLVDRQGQVFWQGRGPFQPETAENLLKNVAGLITPAYQPA